MCDLPNGLEPVPLATKKRSCFFSTGPACPSSQLSKKRNRNDSDWKDDPEILGNVGTAHRRKKCLEDDEEEGMEVPTTCIECAPEVP